MGQTSFESHFGMCQNKPSSKDGNHEKAHLALQLNFHACHIVALDGYKKNVEFAVPVAEEKANYTVRSPFIVAVNRTPTRHDGNVKVGRNRVRISIARVGHHLLSYDKNSTVWGGHWDQKIGALIQISCNNGAIFEHFVLVGNIVRSEMPVFPHVLVEHGQ